MLVSSRSGPLRAQPRRDGRTARRRAGSAALLMGVSAILSGPAAAIVGGREASSDGPEARSTVMVLAEGGGLCTGLVVAPDAVLTAGHCVDGYARNLIHVRDAAGRAVLVEVAARAVHPGYDPDAIRGRARSIDLALLRARAPLPTPLTATALNAAAPSAGESVTLAGYGSTQRNDRRSPGRLRLVTVPVVEPYGPSRILVWLQPPAGAPRAGGCTGDSGGPIAGPAGIVAVTAWARQVCGGLTQGILLGPQRDWIDRTLRDWGGTARWVP